MGVEVAPVARSGDGHAALGVVDEVAVPGDADLGRGAAVAQVLGERHHGEGRAGRVSVELPVLVRADADGDGGALLDERPGEDGVDGVLVVFDLGRGAALAGGRLGVHAVPVDDLVHGDGWGRAVLPPGQVVLGHDAPGGVVHALDVVFHAVAVGDVVGGALVCHARDITQVVRFAKVVPSEHLDDVGREGVLGNVLQALGEESVRVSDPGVGFDTVVQILVLPGRDSCVRLAC